MNFIKKIREDRKVTQMELAKKIGMSKGNLSQIEKGTVGINQENLKKIAEVLNCSISQLIGEASISQDIVYNIKYFENINYLSYPDNNNEFVCISDKLLKILRIGEYKNLIISKSDEKNMEPTISNNDFLIIDTSKKEPFNNRIYIINERNCNKVKRVLMKSPVDSEVIIRSDNEIDGEFPPYKLTIQQMKTLTIGQVIFYGRNII